MNELYIFYEEYKVEVLARLPFFLSELVEPFTANEFYYFIEKHGGKNLLRKAKIKIIISIEALCAGDKFCCQLCNTVISLAAEDRMQVKSASEKLQSSSAIGNCNSDYAKFS